MSRCCLALLALTGAVFGQQQHTFTHTAMGTLFRVTLMADDATKAGVAAQAAFRTVDNLDAALSDYRPESELIRLCQSGDMRVSTDLIAVLQASNRIAATVDGSFDVTCGHLTQLWRRSRRRSALPTSDQLQKAKDLTNWRWIEIDAAAHLVRLAQPGMQLDLGGIAKGYAADAALRVLRDLGYPIAVIAASGDLAIGDSPPHSAGWPIKLRTFEQAEAQDRWQTLHLHNCGVSTSGDLHQFVEIEGHRYSHIIDLRTGLGMTDRRACTVLAGTATKSDALATAMCLLGPESGSIALRQHPEAEARWSLLQADGGITQRLSPGAQRLK
jgi:FAD:protein FMN transferase